MIESIVVMGTIRSTTLAIITPRASRSHACQSQRDSVGSFSDDLNVTLQRISQSCGRPFHLFSY